MQNSIARLTLSCLTLLFLLTASCAPPAPQEEEAAPAEEEEVVLAEEEEEVATEEEEETAPEEEETPAEEEAAATPGPNETSDGRVTIILDKVQRGDVLPPDIVESLSTGRPSYEAPPPDAGCDFVCIYLTISRIEGVLMVDPLGYGEEGSVLLDAQGGEYEPATFSVQGIEFKDLTHLTGDYEVVEGATAFLVFEVPVQEEPSELALVYSFQETWEDESAKRGQIDIVLR